MTCTVYLIRHARPDWQRSDLVYHLPPGPPLTPEGIAEAQALGEFLQQAGVRRLWASPLERCNHTADIAAQKAGAKLENEDALAEWAPGEDTQTVLERLLPVFEKACHQSTQNGPVGLVTHGGPIAVLLSHLGLDEAELLRLRTRFDHRNPLPTAGAWKVTRPASGQPWELSLEFMPPNGSVQ